MTDNNKGAAGADAPGGLPYYEQLRTQLKAQIAKKREIEKKLVSVFARPSCSLSSNGLFCCRTT